MTGLVTAWLNRGRTGADLDAALPVQKLRTTGSGYESIHGKDDRFLVKDVTLAPWRPLVCLQLHSGGQTGVGTGLLIAPDLILTAAHNLYLLSSGKFIDGITAQVGLRNGVAAAEARVTRVEICPGYNKLTGSDDPHRFMFDFGLARLATPALHKWAGATVDVLAQPPLSDTELMKSWLNIAGYPLEAGSPLALKSCDGPVKPGTLDATNFAYEMDSLPGQSGGPVFRYHPESKRVVFAGVHVAGDASKNIARRYDASMRQQLQAWATT
jgi:V8-like Glu-specific endopeptidase